MHGFICASSFLSSFLIVGKEKIDYFCFQYQKESSYGCSNKENPLWDDEFRGCSEYIYIVLTLIAKK